ncbi:nascent polypeptide-associated complex subunit alpha, muscle-specific form-like isoform X2 [Dermacentor albipictus]|uniref:nascent polypeptide-associated complex subunit alpha, muscle-specific form-like isoform X2 n=1 Tax=Dermacentor albipictus TaxID=60249 RepID=UPI0031FD4147
MSGTRAYALGQDELQRRLKKLHHQKDLIVNVLDHLLKRMDLMVAHVSSLTNMNQFLCYFMDASSTMEHMYMKLFKIHVLLTEDTYVDAEQQRVPHMAITYSFHASSDQSSNSQLAVLEAKDRLNCLSSSSQHASSALPHLSICDEVLGRQTSAASFALPQETAAAISSLTAAYARLASGSSLTAPTCDSSGRLPAMAANCSATPGSETYVTAMPAATVPTATVPVATVPVATVPVGTVHAPAVPAPAVPAPVVPAPVVPAPVVPAPVVPAPAVPAPVVPAPAVPAPAVFAPAVSAPAVSAPVVLPIGLTPNCSTTLGSEAYATVHTAVAPAAVAPTAVAHSSAMPPPSLAPYFGTTLYSNAYTATMPAHTVLVPGAAMSGSVIPSPATHGPAVPGPATPGHVAPDPTIPVTFTTPQAPTVAPPVHQPSAEAAGTICGESVGPVSFDQGDAYSYEEEGDQNKWSKLGPCVSVRNIPPTPALPAQSQGSPNWVASDNAAAMHNFTQQKPPESASRPCTSAAAQLPSKLKPPGIPSPNAGVVGTTQDIVLSFYKTPSEFWIQLTTSANILETLLKRLQEHYSSSARRREFTLRAGMYCAAYYAEDGHWYRARILQVTPDHAKVFYVDFGNIDRVDIDCVSFLEEEFASLPAQGFCCSIKGVRSPCGPGMWTIAAVRTFRNMVSRQGTKLQAYFHSQDNVTGRFIVDILSYNEDHISQNLSQEFLSLCSEEKATLPKNQQGMNFTTKRHETHPVVTMSQATSSPVTTAAAVTSSTAMSLVGTPAATTTSVYMPLSGMHTGPALSTSVPPPGMFPAGMPAVSIASASTLPCHTPPTSIAPVSVPHRGMPLAGTPSDGMAPPSAGMSPPPADMAPQPSAGMAPPPAGMSPPPAGMASPLSADMATPPTSKATPPTGMTPPPAGMVPLPTGMAPPPAGTAPPPAGLAQYSTGTAPAPTVKALRPTSAAPAPAATSMAPTAMAPAAMAPATALPGGMESHGMHPATLPPDNLRQAGTAPPALPPALPSVTVPPAVLPEGDTFCVCISVVFNPSDFYGQIVEKANTTAKVLEELQQELNKCGAQSEAPTEEMVNKGSFWICRFEGDKNWYRARVLDVLPGLTCRRFRVLYLDYGNRTSVLCSSLRPLPPELTSLPACAHRMSLAFVGPKKGSKWDRSATGVFVKETGFDVSLVAEKKGHRRSGYEDIMEVVLWNRNGPTAVNINVVLVEQDVARLKAIE